MTDLEIGRDPGGNTDWGQYIADAIRAAQSGQQIRLTSHGNPVVLLTPVPDSDGYDPVPALAALIDGLHDVAEAGTQDGLMRALGHLLSGPYSGLRGGLLLDEPGREGVTAEAAIRQALTAITTTAGGRPA